MKRRKKVVKSHSKNDDDPYTYYSASYAYVHLLNSMFEK